MLLRHVGGEDEQTAGSPGSGCTRDSHKDGLYVVTRYSCSDIARSDLRDDGKGRKMSGAMRFHFATVLSV